MDGYHSVKKPVVATRILPSRIFDCRHNGWYPVCCRGFDGVGRVTDL